ncbi:MAG: winged helix-turn-helix transcriptional regulator [Candidatus Bathyarchaeota archaeon]|nr:MAG: winged helix-turn-helix transcriptional regulator [Candidatus Bathyarchaeota archaeon]
MRKELPQQLLQELLKNSKRSDRELAKVLEVSQPTITRARHRLERDGVIQDYTIVPDFEKMGFEILALTFVKMRPDVLVGETKEKTKKYAAKFPNVIFAYSGRGLSMTGVIISLHKNYTEYHKELNMLRVDLKEITEDIQSFIVAIGEGEYKRFSLTYLGDVTP